MDPPGSRLYFDGPRRHYVNELNMDISGWIERWADFTPNKTAILFGDEKLSYFGLIEKVRACARMLSGPLGVRHGDRVAFLGFNSPDFLVLLFACARLGAMMVPLNWRLTPDEHCYMLDHAGASVLLVEPEFQAGVTKIQDHLGGCRMIRYGTTGEGWTGGGGG